MTPDQMRNVLNEIYPGWGPKLVLMENRRVVAIYKDMERKGRLKKKSRNEPGIVKCRQMTIWDFM